MDYRKQVEVSNKDYWVKPLGNHQENWALIENAGGGTGWVTVYFFYYADYIDAPFCMIFDKMYFPSILRAKAGLNMNGFFETEKNDKYVPPRDCCFYEEEYVNEQRRIYSSGEYWSGEIYRRQDSVLNSDS